MLVTILLVLYLVFVEARKKTERNLNEESFQKIKDFLEVIGAPYEGESMDIETMATLIPSIAERVIEVTKKIGAMRQQKHDDELLEKDRQLETLSQELFSNVKTSNDKITEQADRIAELEHELEECRSHYANAVFARDIEIEKEKAKVLELQATIQEMQKVQESFKVKPSEEQLQKENAILKAQNEDLHRIKLLLEKVHWNQNAEMQTMQDNYEAWLNEAKMGRAIAEAEVEKLQNIKEDLTQEKFALGEARQEEIETIRKENELLKKQVTALQQFKAYLTRYLQNLKAPEDSEVFKTAMETMQKEHMEAQKVAEEKVQKSEKKYRKLKKEVVELEKKFNVLAAKVEDLEGSKD